MTLDLLLKIFIENPTLLGIFFIIAGLIKIFTYYKLFGIYIYEFIEIKEVVILFINNLLAYFIVLIFVSTSLLNLPNIEHLKFVIPSVFTILTLIYYFLRKHVFLYEIIIINFLFWLFYLAIKSLIPTFNENKSNEDIVNNYTLFIIFTTLIVYSITNAFTEYLKVRYKKYYSKTLIYVENDESISNNRKFYIGKTEKFIFLYDSETKSTEAIPSNRIRKIVFSKL